MEADSGRQPDLAGSGRPMFSCRGGATSGAICFESETAAIFVGTNAVSQMFLELGSHAESLVEGRLLARSPGSAPIFLNISRIGMAARFLLFYFCIYSTRRSDRGQIASTSKEGGGGGCLQTSAVRGREIGAGKKIYAVEKTGTESAVRSPLSLSFARGFLVFCVSFVA